MPSVDVAVTTSEELTRECGPMPNVLAAQPNIGGALCERSVIPFLVPRGKVWLTPAAGVPCSNAANIGERKTGTQSEFCSRHNSVRGQEPLKKYIQCNQPRRRQTSCKVWLTSTERCRCSNEAKIWSPLNLPGCPKPTNQSQPLVGRRSPYCEHMWRRYCCLTSFFPIVNTCRSCKDIDSPTKLCADSDFLRPIFTASRTHTFQTCTLNSH